MLHQSAEIDLESFQLALERTQLIDYMINNISNLIFVINKNNHLVYVNDAVVRKYQYTKEELLRMSISDIDVDFKVPEGFWEEFEVKKILHFHSIHKDKNGTLHPVLVNAHYVEYENKVYSFGVVEDQSYIQKLLDTQDGFVILTDGHKLVMANAKMYQFFGYSDYLDFMKEHDCICNFFITEDGFIHNQATWIQDVCRMKHGNAKVKIKNITKNEDDIFLVRASSFDENRFVVTFTDITDAEKYKATLEHLAITDGLTQLFNRRYFNKILPREIKRAKRTGSKIAFIMLDVDYFKLYNDTYGHLNGDEVLIAISKSMQEYFNRGSDFCFRLGGEEFGIICSLDSQEKVYQRTEQLRNDIEELHIEHERNIASKYVTVSIGITLCNGTMSSESLYTKADIELYKAKESGRNRVCMNVEKK
jgi:diguanylate cyclase (GGDEF)-like protein/PAS domain S-box-containing protein